MKNPQASSGTLGAGAVFLTAISTILGAVLFLRFGYAVGNVGLLGTVAIIVLGHFVTLPTAMAIAEIATNQRVAGGGAYHIISRSFGIVIGAAIGIALYLSQAISVAFYVIAFAEAFQPASAWLQSNLGVALPDPRLISVPTTLLLLGLLTKWGASLGVKALYFVVAMLFFSLAFFLFGKPIVPIELSLETMTAHQENAVPFFVVFAIIFPAFTGVAAGLGLSGDLKDPKRAIPIGTVAATIVGASVYLLVAFKLAVSATPDDLGSDQFVMSRIAVWGPIIPLGLAAATLSSALGSVLVAPRTLQAMAIDQVFPVRRLNDWLRASSPRNGEPINAAVVTTIIALVFVLMGDVNFVAQIISMFFMVTYGAICLISVVEHFAADPSYRPAFRSRWYISLFGALACLWFMFEMSPLYATLSILSMFGLYVAVARANPERKGLTNMFQGAVFQISRQFQVFAQKSTLQQKGAWRPSVVAISRHSFEQLQQFELLRWMAHRYGFGTFIHHIEGYFSRATSDQAAQDLRRLVSRADMSGSNVYIDTLVCPSSTSLIAQVVQLPGISGKANNMILFGMSRDQEDEMEDLVTNYQLIVAAGFDVAVLCSTPRGFGYHREIHLWLTPADFDNSPLMILLSYIIVGHPDWREGQIKMFATAPEPELVAEEERLAELIRQGRLPIARENIDVIPMEASLSLQEMVKRQSGDADLIILGFRGELLKRKKAALFRSFDGVGNLLFVNTTKEIEIDRPDEPMEAPEEPEEEQPLVAGESDGDSEGEDAEGASEPIEPSPSAPRAGEG